MALWNIIPTCPDPMSCYTLVGFAILSTAGVTAFTLLIYWIRKEVVDWVRSEIKRINLAISGHDDYIDDTNKTINAIHIDLAVQKTSMKDIKADITEIKKDIKTLLNRP